MCKKHPKYVGKGVPKSACIQCRRIYVSVHHNEFTIQELANKLKVTEATIRNYINMLGVECAEDNIEPEEAFVEFATANKSKKDKNALKKTAEYATQRVEELEVELESALALKNAVGDSFKILPRSKKDSHSESTAIVVASDWHIEEEVLDDQVNGLNHYNLETSEERAKKFFQMALHLTNLENRDTPIKNLVVALLGDFITGNLHEDSAEITLLRPMDASLRVQKYIKSGIDFLLENSDYNLIFVCCSGNHGRITKKIHHATEEGNSLETFVYKTLAQFYADNPRVVFKTTKSYHNYLQVYDTTIRFHHGHSIKYGGGIGGITIPVNKAINEWNKSRWADLDVFGHFHQFFDGGNFIANGSLIGYNAYALRMKCSYEPPKQAFFVINKRWKTKILVRPILFD